MFDQFYTTLESLGIVPVVVLDKVEDAAPLAHALMAVSYTHLTLPTNSLV